MITDSKPKWIITVGGKLYFGVGKKWFWRNKNTAYQAFKRCHELNIIHNWLELQNPRPVRYYTEINPILRSEIVTEAIDLLIEQGIVEIKKLENNTKLV